jgi:hypothetical protein
LGKQQGSDNASIGKFATPAKYTFARALLDDSDEDEAKQRGIGAAIEEPMSRLGSICGGHWNDFRAVSAVRRRVVQASRLQWTCGRVA